MDLPYFKFWCYKVLPLVYDESLSYYETLCKVVDYLNKMLAEQKQMATILTEHENEITELQKEVNFLNNEINKVKNGDYLSLYLDSLINWIDGNIQELVGRIVKYVIPGISDDGYFTILIPFSWDFMQFGTIQDYNNPMYGHLIMRW